jgi:hypothetical protein
MLCIKPTPSASSSGHTELRYTMRITPRPRRPVTERALRALEDISSPIEIEYTPDQRTAQLSAHFAPCLLL